MDTETAQSSEDEREKRRGYAREQNRKRRGDPEYQTYMREYMRTRNATQMGRVAKMINASRHRAKKAGIEHTITADDLDWPTHCPVLGIELHYGGTGGSRAGDNSASLDRWDNDKGYVPGNVRVISNRANCLKNNATWAELHAVARYARYGAAPPELADIW